LIGFVGAGARSGYADLAAGPRLEGGVRLDLPALSLELRGHTAWSDGAEMNGKKSLASREVAATLVALRAIDLGKTTLAGGLAIGTVWQDRVLGIDQASEEPRRTGGVVGALAQVQRMVAGRVYARLEVAGLGYVFDASRRELDADVVWTGALGVGAFF
jgi:hypothetical protein